MIFEFTFNFWKLYPVHSFKVVSLSLENPIQSHSACFKIIKKMSHLDFHRLQRTNVAMIVS